MNNSQIISQLLKGENNAMIARRTREIEELKKGFEETDYQTTKNIQYEKMGKPLPYAWEEIDAKAEAIRIKINEYEAEITNLLELK